MHTIPGTIYSVVKGKTERGIWSTNLNIAEDWSAGPLLSSSSTPSPRSPSETGEEPTHNR